MKKKLFLSVILLFFLISIFVFGSYAFWTQNFFQQDLNHSVTTCLNTEFSEHSDAILLEKSYPISDLEGLASKAFRFSISNQCQEYVGYQVNLEKIISDLKEFPLQYVKASLNAIEPQILTDFTSVTPILQNADASYKLITGTLSGNETVMYELRLWIDENTPSGYETSDATFLSKITVVATPTTEEEIKNEIQIEVTSLTEDYNEESETVRIHSVSENANLTGYYYSSVLLDSYESISWIPILPETKSFEIEKAYYDLGLYYIYFRDELGNISSQEIPISKIDRESPIVHSVTGNLEEWTRESVTLVINDAKDEGIGLGSNPYSFDNGVTWQSSNTKTYTSNTNDIVIQVRDQLGHVYIHPTIHIHNIDKEKPSIVSVSGNPSSWQSEATLVVNGASDTESGLSSYAYSFDNGVTWQSENSKTYTSNTNDIIIKVKDNVGNIYTHSAIHITKIDHMSPTITNVSGNPSSWQSEATLVINGANDGGIGLDSNPYSFDNGVTWQSGNTKTYTSNANNIIIKVRDKFGNIYTHPAIHITKIDDKSPTAKISASTSFGTITVSASGSSDSQSGIKNYQYSRDNKNWVTSTSTTYNFTGLSDGSYTVYVKVTDYVDRVSTISTNAVVAYQNVYVSSSGNDSSGKGTSSSPYATIQKAYSRVGSGYNIILLSNITSTSTANFNTSGKTVILKSNGSSVYSVVRGSSLKSSLLSLASTNTLHVHNINFNGNGVSSTSPLLNVSGSSTLNLNSGVTVQKAVNTSTYSGGGVNVTSGSSLNVNGATITNNKASNQGAGIYNNGGTITFNSGTISSNTFSGSGGEGAGIFGWGGTINIKGGTISDNKNAVRGGGVFMGNSGRIVMSNGTITKNSNAGIAIASSASMTITGGTISSNTSGFGGGIIVDEATLDFSNALVKDNTASSGGGGLNCNSNSTCTLKSGTFENNSASSGGAIHISSAVVNLQGVTLKNNRATGGDGGAAVVWSGTLHMSSGTISGNVASSSGGGISYLDSSKGTISGGTISSNTSSGGAGGGGIIVADGSNVMITNINITGNTATWGGGIALAGNAGVPTLTFKGGTVQNNTATGNAGGIDINNGILNLQGGNVINNKCNTADNVGGIAVCCNGKYNYSSGNVSGNTPKNTW